MTYGDEQAYFIESYNAVRDDLTMEQKGILLDLLVDYVNGDGDTKTEDKAVKMAYRFIANRMRKVQERYLKKCETNRENVNKRWGKNKKTEEC